MKWHIISPPEPQPESGCRDAGARSSPCCILVLLSAFAALFMSSVRGRTIVVTFGIDDKQCRCDCVIFWAVLPVFTVCLIIVHVLMRTGGTKPSFTEAVSYMNCSHSLLYRRVPHNDVSVNDTPHMRLWSHKILVL